MTKENLVLDLEGLDRLKAEVAWIGQDKGKALK
jgi:hypothetical protein